MMGPFFLWNWFLFCFFDESTNLSLLSFQPSTLDRKVGRWKMIVIKGKRQSSTINNIDVTARNVVADELMNSWNSRRRTATKRNIIWDNFKAAWRNIARKSFMHFEITFTLRALLCDLLWVSKSRISRLVRIQWTFPFFMVSEWAM